MSEMNYSELSDLEINKLVAAKLGYKFECNHPEDEDSIQVWNGSSVIYFDPCNDPSDAWPIIESNFISIEYHHGSYVKVYGYCDSGKVEIMHGGGAIRGAMIAFLMMHDGKRD